MAVQGGDAAPAHLKISANLKSFGPNAGKRLGAGAAALGLPVSPSFLAIRHKKRALQIQRTAANSLRFQSSGFRPKRDCRGNDCRIEGQVQCGGGNDSRPNWIGQFVRCFRSGSAPSIELSDSDVRGWATARNRYPGKCFWLLGNGQIDLPETAMFPQVPVARQHVEPVHGSVC